jgi:hypothetical protein
MVSVIIYRWCLSQYITTLVKGSYGGHATLRLSQRTRTATKYEGATRYTISLWSQLCRTMSKNWLEDLTTI